MITTTLQVTQTIFAFALVVLLVVILKARKVVSTSDLKSYSTLLTKAVLPAVIFLQLALHPVHGYQFVLVLIMFISGVISMGFTWVAGKLLKLKNETLGMLMITSTFGSSALMGYPLIRFAFPDNQVAMTDAILISELGVGLPIFTLCPLIASYYGKGSSGYRSMMKTLINYIQSPIFIAVVIGIIAAHFEQIVSIEFLQPFWVALRMIDGTLTFLACLILGLQLKFASPRRLIPLFLVSAIIQMGVQPLLVYYGADFFHTGTVDKQVLILISAMPSAVLSTVFASEYDCDPEGASQLVFLNIVAGLIGIPLVYYGLFS
jgi:malate permease and related proteins